MDCSAIEEKEEEDKHEFQIRSHHFNESVSTYTDYNSINRQPNVKNHKIYRLRVVIIIIIIIIIIIVNIFNAIFELNICSCKV